MIYPKDYNSLFAEQEENTAFVIMPFKQEFSEIYGEICQICIDLNISCLRADEIFANRAIMENILERIAKAEVIIADLTEKNPNVYYEVGIAHSLRDEDNVILITQDIQTSPFDINHRSILIYDKRNLIKFKSDLKKRILTSKNISKRKDFFKTYLLNNGIKKEEAHIFIETSEKLSPSKLDIIFQIIKQRPINPSEINIDGILSFFSQLEDFQSGEIRKSSSLVKMEMLSSDMILNNFEDAIQKVLIKSNHNLIHLDDKDTFIFIANFCFKLIEKNRLKSEALSWILDYLNNYRMGRIDVIRSKIENFLVKTLDVDVDILIVNMLKSKVITVKESAADICGQKQLTQAIPVIIDILKIEENPHVVRSCITALTRLKALNAVPAIHDWMINNQDKWGEQAVSASLKNIALLALKELDGDSTYLKSFEKLINLK